MVPVPLPHALGVRRPDVLVHDLLPTSPAKPAPEEALNLLNLGNVRIFGVLFAAVAVLLNQPDNDESQMDQNRTRVGQCLKRTTFEPRETLLGQ